MSQPSMRGTLERDGMISGLIITSDDHPGRDLAGALHPAIGREVQLFGPYNEERGNLYWVLVTTDGDRL